MALKRAYGITILLIIIRLLFRDQILKEFANRFRGMQGSLLWTILLDPRLTEWIHIWLKEILKNLIPMYVTHFFGGRLIVKIFLYWRG